MIDPGRRKMINRQQGFTLLEVMAALAIFSMLGVLAFMVFSQASTLHQRSQKEIQQFNQLQRTITILDNDLLQLVARRNRSTDKIMVLGEEAIFTTQSRDPLAPLSEAQTLTHSSLVSTKSYALPCCSYFCGWQEGSTRPGDAGTCRELSSGK